MVVGGFRTDRIRAVPPATGQCGTCHPKTSAGVSVLCCSAGGAEKGCCENGSGLAESVVGGFALLFGCVFIRDGETQVSSKTLGFAVPAGLQHHVWPERTSPPRMCHCFFLGTGVTRVHTRAGQGWESQTGGVMLSTECRAGGCQAVRLSVRRA